MTATLIKKLIMPVYIYSFDLPKGMPEVTDYFTEDNSGNTLNSGIWNRVYVGLVDCGISDQIFDCLNITRTLYLHLTWTDRMILHKVRGLFKGFCDTPYKEVREAIFSAFTELLSKKDFNQITVGEIIDSADIGRATFYAHFETKDFLLKEFCEELFCHIFDTEKNTQNNHKHIFVFHYIHQYII